MKDIATTVSKVRRFYIFNKRIPTYQEIAEIFNFKSKNAAYKLANKLIKEGVLERDVKGRLTPKRLFLPMKYFGSIKAGFPAPAEDQLVDTVSIDALLMTNPEENYLLKVSGDSMIGAGLYDEDIVVVDSQREPKVGDIVVAYIDHEWTLKYFQKDKKGEVMLVPANDKYPTLRPKEDFAVGGVVMSSIRKYH